MSAASWQRAATSRFRVDGSIGTPFHTRTAALNTTPWIFNWDICHVPDEYVDMTSELKAIRTNLAMGDMSPLTKIEVSGPDAPDAVNYLMTRDATKLEVGQIFYTPMCNQNGHTITPAIVMRTDPNSYRFTLDPTYEWFLAETAGFDVQIVDVTDDWGILTLQGPRSLEVLNTVTGDDWTDLMFSRIGYATVDGVDVEIARTGFTGELGYEFHVPTRGAEQVWDVVYEKGANFGIVPAGEWCLDVARVEAALLLPGPDYTHPGPDPCGSHTTASTNPEYLSTPFELGEGHFVEFDAPGDFVGKEALRELEHDLSAKRLQGLSIDWKTLVQEYVAQDIAPTLSPRVRWETLDLHTDKGKAGWASSVTWSPSTKRMIGFGHVDRAIAENDDQLLIEWDVPGGSPVKVRADRVDMPFLPRRRATQ